jgi:GT2 family glycosyltransferase
MTAQPEIALLVSSYNRAEHLRRALLSIGAQQGVDGKMEVVVTDDGSTDNSAEVARQFANSVDFSVKFATHPHNGYHLTKCRNQGVKESTAPYILFLDGDCSLPPDHVRHHLETRRKGLVVGSDCVRLDEATSARVTDDDIRNGRLIQYASPKELARMRSQYRKAWFYQFIRHADKPKLIGNNIALWREDYERINGYDEQFVGLYCEDDDLRMRLRRAGLKATSLLNKSFTFHFWHPIHHTGTPRWRDGVNVKRLTRPGRLTACRVGLKAKEVCDLQIQVLGEALHTAAAKSVLKGLTTTESSRPEIEVVVAPGTGKFSGRADCNILVLTDSEMAPRSLIRKAHILVGAKSPAHAKQVAFEMGPISEIIRKAA